MRIYHLYLKNEIWERNEQDLFKYLSNDRRMLCDRFRFDKDKKLCLYSELLLKYTLFNDYDISHDEFIIRKDKNNKPFLDNKTLYFNYSHSEKAIILAVSRRNEIGADIEYISENVPFEITDTVFCDDEKKYLDNSNSINEKIMRFYEIWTKKEAYTKSIGSGIVADLKEINVINEIISNQFISGVFNEYYVSVFCGGDNDAEDIFITDFDLYKFFIN